MCDEQEIVDRYFHALAQRDLATLRGLVHDDLTFTGPLAKLDNADDYLQGLEHITAHIQHLERRRVFCDGQSVVQLYDVTLEGPGAALPVAEWLQIRGDRIVAIEMIMDPRPLVAHLAP